jgi:CHAD domain-containing protein
VARGRIDHALAALDLDDRDEAVHEVRRAGKQLRALLRLVRDAAPELSASEDAAVRATTARLAEVRDAAVSLETFEALAAGAGGSATEGIAAVRAGLMARRQEVVHREDLEAVFAVVRTELLELRERVDGWEVDGTGFGVPGGGLRRTYRRCRRQARDARRDPSPEVLHAWRRQAKHHRYHLELLRPLWPVVVRAHEDELHRLTDLLGEHHDLAVLLGELRAEPDTFGGVAAVDEVTALIHGRQGELEADAITLGRRCFAEPPAAFVGRLERYWRVATTS